MSLLLPYLHNSALSTPAPEQGLLDECSHDARRFRCEVGPREDRRERRRVMRDHHLRILAKDAVNRCGLGLHRQDAPPLAGVRKLGRPPQQRVDGRDFQPHEVADDREDIRPPATTLLTRQDDIMDAVGSN